MRPLPNLHPWSGLEPGIKTRKRMHVDRCTIALSTHAHFLIRKNKVLWLQQNYTRIRGSNFLVTKKTSIMIFLNILRTVGHTMNPTIK